MDRVLYFGASDSPDARDSVFRFRSTAGEVRGLVWGVGCEDCRFNAPGDAFGFGIACGGVAGVTTAARVPGDGLCEEWKPFCVDLGDSNGFMGISSEVLLPNGFSSPSFGRRDSVEPLFRTDRAVGGRSSINRANSICRRAICPLSSSNLEFQSGMSVQSFVKASLVEVDAAILYAVGP